MLLNKHAYVDADLSRIDLDFGQHCFTSPEATFPWLSQAQWFTGHIRALSERAWANKIAPLNQVPLTETYLTETYRTVAEKLNINVPTQNTKAEGTHADSWQLSGTLDPINMLPDLMFK